MLCVAVKTRFCEGNVCVYIPAQENGKLTENIMGQYYYDYHIKVTIFC